MKRQIFFSFLCFIFCSGGVFAQKPFQSSSYLLAEISFSNSLDIGVFFNMSPQYTGVRQLYFGYNYKKKNWRLKKDSYNSLFPPRRAVFARFQNPKGGRDFYVKVSKRGKWSVYAPQHLRKILKNKVRRYL